MKTILSCFAIMTFLASCASDPIDPLDPNQGAKNDLQAQCPVGQEPVYSTAIVLKSTDKDKKTGTTRKTYKCEQIK